MLKNLFVPFRITIPDKRQYPKSRAAYTDTNARLVSLPLAVATVADSQGKSAFTQPRRQARVTVFAPDTFRRLRSKFKIDEADFVRSLGGGRFVSFRSNSKGSARSGE